jgi:hypothetical protein
MLIFIYKNIFSKTLVMSTNKLSEYLYAKPSFWEGIARLMDISGSLSVYNTALTPTEADNLALLSDWLVVGDDLRESITLFEKQNHNSNIVLTETQRKLLNIIGK